MRSTDAAAAAGGFRGVAAVLTTRCNLRCHYCYQRRDAPRTMSWPTLRAAIDVLLAGGAAEPELSLTGGEPLLAMPMVRRAARYLDEHAPPGVAPRLHVTTNGMALDGETLRFLARRRVKVVLSFDGVERAQALRGAGTFAVLDELLARLARDFPAYFADDVTVSVTLSSATVGFLADSARYFLDRRLPSFDVAAVETHDPGWGDGSFAALDRQLRGDLRAVACRVPPQRHGAVSGAAAATAAAVAPPRRPDVPDRRRARRARRRGRRGGDMRGVCSVLCEPADGARQACRGGGARRPRRRSRFAGARVPVPGRTRGCRCLRR